MVVGHELDSTLGSTDAAYVVAATVPAAALALSGLGNPSTVSRAARLTAMSSAVECRFDPMDDDDGNEVTPDFVDLPLQTAMGDGVFAQAVGSLIVTGAATLVLPSLLIIALRVAGGKPQLITMASLVAFILTSYFSPTMAETAMMVVVWSENAMEKAVGVASLAISAALPIVWAVSVVRIPPTALVFTRKRVNQTNPAISNADPASGIVETFGVAIEHSRDASLATHRIAAVNEVLLATLLGAASGLRPRTYVTCVTVASANLFLGLLHLVFLLKVRPYARRMDSVFAVGNAFILIVTGIVGFAATAAATSVDAAAEARNVYMWVVTIAFLSFYVQVAVGFFWFLALRVKRGRRNPHQDAHNGGGQGVSDTCAGASSDPLLVVHEAASPPRLSSDSGSGAFERDRKTQQNTSTISSNALADQRQNPVINPLLR